MPAKYKLSYFNARGRAELCRLCFAAAGQDFQDDRVDFQQWPERKKEMPMGFMPVLEVDGEKFSQANAIARYIARQFDLYTGDNLDDLKIDEIYETYLDLWAGFAKLFGEPDEKKSEMLKSVRDGTFPKVAEQFQRRLCENNSGAGYIVGKKLSLGDVVVFNALEMAIDRFAGAPDAAAKGDILAPYPQLKAYFGRISAEPSIAAWVRKRPQTAF